MSGESFDQMKGVSWADYGNRTNGTPDVKLEAGKLEAVEQAFADDPKIRVMCPRCKRTGEGTLAELTLHVETCDATD